jgi:hypothetical protein
VLAAREDAKRQTDELWKEVHASRKKEEDAKAEALARTVELRALRESGLEPDPESRRRREDELSALKKRASDAESNLEASETRVAELRSALLTKTAEAEKHRAEAEKDRDAAATLRGALAGLEAERVVLVDRRNAAENASDALFAGFRKVFEVLAEAEDGKEEGTLPEEIETENETRGKEELARFFAARAETVARSAVAKRVAAAERADALEARLRSAREQHERLVGLHDDAMRRVVASGTAASAAEAREELAEIREEVVALRAAAASDAALRLGALAEAREEAAREAKRADAASAAAERAREALVGAEATARERERIQEEALFRCREELRRAKEKA